MKVGELQENCLVYVVISAHRQYGRLHTIFNYMFNFGPPGKYLYRSLENRLPSVGFDGRGVVGLGKLNIDSYFHRGPKSTI